MQLEDLEHLRLVVRLLRIAGDAGTARPDQAEVLDQALAAFLTRYGLEPGQAIPLLETLAFPDRDR
jgi:hypothetical protein